MSMNLPPRFEDAALDARMQAGIEAVAGEGLDLFLTYQDPAAPLRTAPPARNGCSRGCRMSRPIGSLSAPARKARWWPRSSSGAAWRHDMHGSLTYPGFLALAAHLGIHMQPVAMDADGFCRTVLRRPARRKAQGALLHADAAQSHHRDHSVGAAEAPCRNRPPPWRRDHRRRCLWRAAAAPIAPLAALAPDCVYHIAGLSKCLSPALRIAYLVLPDLRIAARAASAVRAFAGMASPLTAAIVTRWMDEGTAAAVLDAIRKETAARQAIAAKFLPSAVTKPDCFHAWLSCPRAGRPARWPAARGLKASGL